MQLSTKRSASLPNVPLILDLARNEKGFISGSDSVLLEAMAVDSDTHVRLLQFVQRRLEAAASTARHLAAAT